MPRRDTTGTPYVQRACVGAISGILRSVGQRTPTETLFGIVSAFVEKRTWSQSDLADPASAGSMRGNAVAEEEERWLAVVEDAISQKTAMKLRYFTASRRHESWRHVSVHRIDAGPRLQFIATCHTANALRRFRLCNVLDARLDPAEMVRSTDAVALRVFDEESFGGFRQDGPSVLCTFVVRDPESAWVARNLPDDRIVQEAVPGGIRFRAQTTAVVLLGRFVAGLGDAARPETKELAEQVAPLARGALANATSR